MLLPTIFIVSLAISMTACGGGTKSVSPQSSMGDFSVTIQPNSFTLTPNLPQTLQVYVTSTGSFNGIVDVTLTPSSSHLTLSKNSLEISPGTSQPFMVTADTSLVSSTPTISVVASSGSLQHSSQLSIPVGKVLTLNFSPRVDLSSGGSRPAALAVADFNGDGNLDIAVANTISNTISVLLGNGDGTFHPPVITQVNVTNTIGAMVVGDFNEDGKQDLVVATVAGPQVSLLMRGNGDGTFVQQAPVPQSFGFDVGAVADLNGDKHIDFVAPSDGGAAVFLGAGDGTFPTRHDLTNPSSPAAFFGVTVADFNNDGKLDIAAMDYGGTQGIMDTWLGNGDGTFQPASSSPLFYFGGSGMASADLNHDGNQDILVGFSNSVEALLGNGDGTFQTNNAKFVYAGSANGQGVYIVAADMNLDGPPDVVVTNYVDGTLNIMLNDDANFSTPMSYPNTYKIAPNTGDVKVADFNKDGIPDVVTVNDATGNISLFLSQSQTAGTKRAAALLKQHP